MKKKYLIFPLLLSSIVIPTVLLSSCSISNVVKDKINLEIKVKDNITQAQVNLISEEITNPNITPEELVKQLSILFDGITLSNIDYISFTITKDNDKNITITLKANDGYLINNGGSVDTIVPEVKPKILTQEIVRTNLSENGIWSKLENGDLLASYLNGYTEIGNDAFNLPFNLMKPIFAIQIPNTITKIGDSAFKSISQFSSNNIRNIIFEKGSTLKTIGNKAFYYCSNLKGVQIPNSVISIGDDAFNTTSSKLQLEFESNPQIESIGIKSFANLGNSQLILPNSLKSINNSAFMGCSSLEEIYIPTSVTTIGNRPFLNTWLSPIKKVTIPLAFKNRSDKLGFDDDVWKIVTFI